MARRNAAAAAAPAPVAADTATTASASDNSPPTRAQKLEFYFAQYLGAALVALALAATYGLYGKGYCHDTLLMLGCLGACLAALFVFEHRPYNVRFLVCACGRDACVFACTLRSQGDCIIEAAARLSPLNDPTQTNKQPNNPTKKLKLVRDNLHGPPEGAQGGGQAPVILICDLMTERRY